MRHLAPVSLAIFLWPIALAAQNTPGTDPRYEIFGGYSFNTDFVRDQPVLLIQDQKVSPFFSNGSGPFGFEASAKRHVRGSLGLKATFSGYFDPFFEGPATYCQPTVCALNVHAKDRPQTFYAMFGPEWKFRRANRISPFVFALGGVAITRSAFEISGSNVTYANGYRKDGLVVFNSGGFPQNGTVRYSDASSDAGFAFSVGGGFDARLRRRLSLRLSLAYDPTFLAHPVVTNPTVVQPIASERGRQDHIALSLGLVWGVR